MLRTVLPYRHLVLTALVLGLSFFWDGCAVNPVSGKKQFMLMSESQELALGKQSDPSIVAQFGMYQDNQLQSFLNEKGQEMAKVSHR
ncbi:MAG: peptidase M48, partial [Bacteroidota bacterium]